MIPVKENNNGFKMSTKPKSQLPKQRYKIGVGNTRYEFTPTEGYQVDEAGVVLTAEDVSDLWWNPAMTLQTVKGRSLGVYWTDEHGVPHFKGFASFNDGKTQLTVKDHAEDMLQKGREQITLVTSNVEQKSKIKEGSNRDRK